VHVLSRKKLLDAAVRHNDLSVPVDVWYRIAKKAEWKSLTEVRQTFPTADLVEITRAVLLKPSLHDMSCSLPRKCTIMHLYLWGFDRHPALS
jgi:hypothetical protein